MLTLSPVVPGIGDRQPRILAVDDQPANLLLVKRVLEPAGFHVLEARSGAEALAVAQESVPDLILLDMHLPDMHGLEVLRRLRESAWGAGLRTVAMSALSSPEDRALWMQAGCVGSIDKPINVKQFVLTISQWLPGAAVSDSEKADGPTGEERDPSTDRLGEILVANNLLTLEQLQNAVHAQSQSGRRLGQVLVDRGDVSEDDIAWALSNQLGYPYVFLTGDIIDEDAAHLLPEAFLREHLVLPILKFGQEMTLAMADPTDQRTVDEVATRTRLQVKRALALASNIDEMLDRLFAPRDGGSEPAAATEAQYLQFHLVQAIQQGATEIHFDPAPDGQARVRYRVQDVLVDRANLPAELHAAITAHLRSLTGAGDAPVRTASVGVTAGPADLHLTATFLPTMAGPAATITLYPRRGDVPDLAPLGVPEEPIRRLRDVLKAHRGVVMVGCAGRLLRSTLLHALIPPVQRGKVWSLETLPVYRRPTLNQTAIGSGAEVAGYLRGTASAEADLVMVDDTSRRQDLVAACETGRARMVLAGHPQDDVVGLLSQLLDAAGPALVASCLRGVLTARRVRLLCPACKEASTARTFIPRGCEACAFTGFRGERVLVQTWLADEPIRMLLRAAQLGTAYERIAREVGAPMREQGLSLIEDGLSSKEEVMAALEGVAWT
ncbi:MAG: ATPase, T2SS/T4P/T4SS family [Armatimonadota bacterium]